MGCSADLSSDALLEISGDLIAYANPACERLLAGSATPVPLTGRSFSGFFGETRLDSACEAPLAVSGRALDGGALLLVARAARGQAPGGYAVRLDSATGSCEPQQSRAIVDLVAKVFDLASDSILVVDHETMAYLYANKAVCAFHGLTREEFLRLKPWDLTALLPREEIVKLYDDLVAAAPEARSAVHTITSLTSGRTTRALIQRQAIHIDGRWIIVLIGRDVTEIERTEARIERFSYALDQIGDGVLLIDYEASAFLDVNETACRILGYSREELMRRTPASVVDAPLEDMQRIYRQVVDQSPVTQAAESRVIRSDGSTITCEVLRQAIKSGDRWVLVVTFRDITEQLQAQARLQRLATALDLSSDYFMLLDHETMTYVDANEASCEFHGLSREQLQRARPWELTSPVLREEDIRRIHDEVVAAAPQSLRGVHTVTSLFSGRSVRMLIQRQAIRMEGRWMVVFIGRDITEIERNEARTKRFVSALNQSPDGVFLVDYQTELFLDVNETACTMLGYTREQLMGIAPISVIDAPKKEMRKIYRSLLDRSPATQVAESRVIRADGTKITCEVLRQAIKSEGRWVLIVTLRDITEKKAVLARQAMLATALDLGEDACFIVDRETMRYLDVNEAACRLLGATRERLLNEWVPNQSSPELGSIDDLAAAFDEAIRAVPATTVAYYSIHRTDGAVVPCEVRRQALLSGGRWIITAIVRDISERVRAEAEIDQRIAELERSNRELEQFAYVTSHDLSEPLRMVGSYTQLLQRRYAGQLDDDAREFMGFIVDGAQRMKRLIDDLLLYSRAGRGAVRHEPLSLDEALDDALANLAHVIRETGSVVERAPLPVLPAEKSAMVQVFQNLVANAVKFRSQAPPAISIGAQRTPQGWTIFVKDNGIGIEPRYFDRIFVIFQRLHARGDYEGTGIGLAICKKVVERHGGRIEVRSAPGDGTTFLIHLPAQENP